MVSIIWASDKDEFSSEVKTFLEKISESQAQKTVTVRATQPWDVVITVHNKEKLRELFNKFEKIAQDQFGIESYTVATTNNEFKLRY